MDADDNAVPDRAAAAATVFTAAGGLGVANGSVGSVDSHAAVPAGFVDSDGTADSDGAADSDGTPHRLAANRPSDGSSRTDSGNSIPQDAAPSAGSAVAGVLDSALTLGLGAAWKVTAPARWGLRFAVDAAGATLRRNSRVVHRVAQAQPGGRARLVDRVIEAVMAPVIRKVVAVALRELDLTAIVVENVDIDTVAEHLNIERVLDRVDLDGVVARVDLDAAVSGVDLEAVVARLDLDRIVDGVDLERIVGKLDLDAIVDRVDIERILAKLDLDAIVDRVDIERILAKLDLDAIVDRVDIERILAKLDLDAIVERVDLDRVVVRLDLDQIVERVDLERIINRLDIDAIVEKVDIDRIVGRVDVSAVVATVNPDPIVARVDFNAALDRIDLITIAQQVVDGIDLPAIIRDSTGSLASDAVTGVRVQGQHADDAVSNFVGRMLRRRPSDENGQPHP